MISARLSILVVEDDDYKFARIERVIEEFANVEITRKVTGTVAMQWLRSNSCAVLILDLSIPARDNESPNIENGMIFLDELQRADSDCSIPNRVIGLSAFADDDSEYRKRFERDGWILVTYDSKSSDWTHPIKHTVEREAAVQQVIGFRGCVVPLHGIRTYAHWQKTFADIAFLNGVYCPTDGWWYGRFSVFAFLLPIARRGKIQWFRTQFTRLLSSVVFTRKGSICPSVVAHSFGTYILGYALLKYRDLRVNRVILCGSILPRDFPWDKLIESGQVGAVYNCIGTHDIWPLICSFVIPGTGSSGRFGFRCGHSKLSQERHFLSHSEFFDAKQMESHWLPFILDGANYVPHVGRLPPCKFPKGDLPLLALILGPMVFTLLLVLLLLTIFLLSSVYVQLCYLVVKQLSGFVV